MTKKVGSTMEIENNITIRDADLKEHTLIIGKEGSGKTKTILKPLLLQLLQERSEGNKIGITVIESNNDLSYFTEVVSHKLDLQHTAIDINKDDYSYNIMEGEAELVANHIDNVVGQMFNENDRFFSTIHQLILKNVTLLLKGIHEDDLNIFDLSSVLKNKNLLREKIDMYKKVHNSDDTTNFLEHEVLGSLKEKYEQFTHNLIIKIDSLKDSDTALDVLGKKTTIDLESHIRDGGVLTVTTDDKTSGNALAKSMLMRLQNLIIQSNNQIPHFIIINNAGSMINSDTELFLSLSGSKNTSCIYTFERLIDLEVQAGKHRPMDTKQMLIQMMKNRIVFNQDISDEDAMELIPFLNHGKVVVKEKKLFRMREQEYNLDIENIHFFPKYTFIHQLMKDGKREKVGIGIGSFVPEKFNWK